MARKKHSLEAVLGIPTKDRKQIAADEKVALELSDREPNLIMKHTFAGDELTDRLRIVPRPGEPPVYRFIQARRGDTAAAGLLAYAR